MESEREGCPGLSGKIHPEGKMARAVRGVCAAQLEPDDPCMGFLRDRGYDLEGGEGEYDFAKQPSPLKGKRWYVPVEIRGRKGEFLLDTGASHSMIGQEFYQSLAAPSDDPVGTGRVRAANGMEMRTYGRQVLSLHIMGSAFIASPTIAELTDDGILGLDFCCLYGASLDPSTGLLSIQFPTRKEVACVLRRVSGTATVVQTVRVAPQHVCNVLLKSTELTRGQMGIIEPDSEVLGELGLLSTGALVQNPRWTVVPVCNPTLGPIYLEKGTRFGAATLVDVGPQLKEEAVVGAAFQGAPEAADYPLLPEYLRVLVEDSHLQSAAELESLGRVLGENQDVFAAPGSPLGMTDRVMHHIDTGDSSPIRLPYRRLPMVKKRSLEEEVDKMLQEGVIMPTNSPWASPVVMVTKKDGTCRFCIDYRKLNGVTRKNAYPLPRIDESVESLGGNNWFCTLDLQSGYWQIGMHPEDREKTAFTTHRGLFEFNVMPFGLCNAPATFECMMEAMLSGLLGKSCLVYLDDVVVFGRSARECLQNLEEVFSRLREYNLKLKPKKCKLFRQSVEYLGPYHQP